MDDKNEGDQTYFISAIRNQIYLKAKDKLAESLPPEDQIHINFVGEDAKGNCHYSFEWLLKKDGKVFAAGNVTDYKIKNTDGTLREMKWKVKKSEVNELIRDDYVCKYSVARVVSGSA